MKDKKGRTIMVGDLVRSYHYKDRRWGHQYLYHVVCDAGEKYFELRPTGEVAFGHRKENGGRCWLTEDIAAALEIIHANCPYPDNIYQERA